jgi:hypothetical protein
MGSTAKLELESLSGIKPGMHHPDKGEKIDSHYYAEDYKIAWYSKQKHKFECLTTADNKVRFTIPDGMCFLYDCFLRQKFPEVKVKKEYRDTVRLCWTNYVAIAAVEEAMLKVDGCEPTSFTRFWYNVQMQYFRNQAFSKQILEHAGQKQELTEWTDVLPEFESSVKQPFFYTRVTEDALPLAMNPNTKAPTVVQHIYTLRNKLSQLLRMQQKSEEGEWEDIKFSPQYINGPLQLEHPELTGQFSVNTDLELSSYRCESDGIVRYYDDVIHITSENDETMGKVFSRSLGECNMPCKAMFWMCENMTSSDYNLYSNFTTNSSDISQGLSPIESSTLSYGGKNLNKFVNLQTDNEFEESLLSLPSPSIDRGYQCHTFCNNPLARLDVGVNLSEVNAKLVVNLRTDESNTDKFRLHILMLVTRKLIIRRDESGRFVYSVSE